MCVIKWPEYWRPDNKINIMYNVWKYDEIRKEYWNLNSKLRRETDKAGEERWEDTCDELEYYDKRGRSGLLHYGISCLTKTGEKVATKNPAMNDVSGELRTKIR